MPRTFQVCAVLIYDIGILRFSGALGIVRRCSDPIAAVQVPTHDVLEGCLLEGPASGPQVEVIEGKEPLPVSSHKLQCSEDELELLVGHVVGEADSRPSGLRSAVTLQRETRGRNRGK